MWGCQIENKTYRAFLDDQSNLSGDRGMADATTHGTKALETNVDLGEKIILNILLFWLK